MPGLKMKKRDVEAFRFPPTQSHSTFAIRALEIYLLP
jgi:hypothetical protein